MIPYVLVCMNMMSEMSCHGMSKMLELTARQMFLCLRAQHPALQTATTSLPEKRCNIKSLVAYMNGQWAFTTPLLPVKTKHIAKWRCQAAANEAEACQRATPAFCNNPQDSALIGNSECQARNIETQMYSANSKWSIKYCTSQHRCQGFGQWS